MEIMRHLMVPVFSLLAVIFASAQQVESNFRQWVSIVGTKINAELISADHNEVILKTKNKKILKLHPSKLSKPDLSLIHI